MTKEPMMRTKAKAKTTQVIQGFPSLLRNMTNMTATKAKSITQVEMMVAILDLLILAA